jgi:hypothetical protein
MPERIPQPGAVFFRRLPSLTLPRLPWRSDLCTPPVRSRCRFSGRYAKRLSIFRLLSENWIDRKQVLELFHGPTAAFKDFGARFMAGCFRYFFSRDDRRTVILVATSAIQGVQ